MNEEIKKYLTCLAMVLLVLCGVILVLFISLYLMFYCTFPLFVAIILACIAAMVYDYNGGESLEFFRGLNPWRNKDE